MDVAKITVSRDEARDLYEQYKHHRHYATPVDDEIRRAYREISRGKLIIQALESIKRAGLGADGRPNLAIARADLPHIHLDLDSNGRAVFLSDYQRTRYRNIRDTSTRITLPPGSFPGAQHKGGKALLPLIPIHLRPRHGLDQYHILWEAEWQPVPPKDPYLLRRIGEADLWLVVAAWDLTEVERAALATRVTAQ